MENIDKSRMTEPETLDRASPHLDPKHQAIVQQLMKDYPKLDQLMAETIVWHHLKESDEQKSEDAEDAGMAEAKTE